MSQRASIPFLPHVGRSAALAQLREGMAAAAAGKGGVHLIAGPSGIGKTRLVTTVAATAERAGGWQAGIGRIYPVESGAPYAVWSDALTSLLRTVDSDARRVLTRGGSWLGTICPAFASETPREDPDARDVKSSLLWNCAQFLGRLGEKRPVLLVLENLHLADAASLELLHFVGRQAGDRRIAILGTYNETELDRQPALREVEQSLLALGVATLLRLEALTESDTEQAVCEAFGVDHPSARRLARRLFAWTRGHPYFLEETLKSLVDGGRLTHRDGRWQGWDVGELGLPSTVRLAVSQRLNRLSENARTVAGAAAVVGARVRAPVLRDATDLSTDAVLDAMDELVRQGLLVEVADAAGSHEFAHPIIQDVVYQSMGSARARTFHARVARSLEASIGSRMLTSAGHLAFHFSRAEPEDAGDKAVLYMAAAGRQALARHADRAAADYLSAALERSSGPAAAALIDDLAQARQRLGDYDAAMALWQRAAADALAANDVARRGRVQRRMGLASYWSGRFEDALQHFDAALATASAAGDDALRVQVQLSRGACWQPLGRPADAERELQDALRMAEQLGDQALLARAHRALLFLHIFAGPPEAARRHGERALSLSDTTRDPAIRWSAHYGLATLAGLTGDGPSVAHHVERAEAVAEELQSPLLRAYSDEVATQYRFATGDWDAAAALAERSIATARALGQRTLLPRALVWATNVHIARSEFEQAKRLLDEAWDVGVARVASGEPIEVHSQILVYGGLAAYHLATGDHALAIEVGEQGLAIADRVGYTVWAVYRLLPVITEAALWSRDVPRAQRHRDRMHRDCTRMNHRLGLVWVAAADGLIARLNDDNERAARLLRGAVEDLERIPWVYDAARLRRWLGDVYVRLGDTAAAVKELRACHDTCARLGALVEVDRARVTMKQLGVRPPARVSGTRARLTVRESDIAQLVIDRRSNKVIAAKLGIATRTVTTHVANIFSKLGVSSRLELAERLRDSALT